MAILRTEDLTKSYSGRTVVRGVNLEISSGEVVGLLGPNGAGKTTTLKVLSGLLHPTGGEVEVDGFVPFRRDAEATVMKGNNVAPVKLRQCAK